ncbi:MAG: GNAT family N-acetyltransferase [Xanthomonadales bacterium]|nr:GNAT family N-acetyltransferase [Xanthomonadales bacterium]
MQPVFQWSRLSELGGTQFHQIIAAREAVFVVEQNCPYQDADHHDDLSWHLSMHIDGELAAYLRIVDPGHKYPEPSIGRVLTTAPFRGRGLGQRLMAEAIDGAQTHYPGQPIRISAQVYLLDFYRSFGFQVVGEVYLEDGIEHQEMLRAGA